MSNFAFAFYRKNSPDVLCLCVAQVGTLIQYFLACNFKLWSANSVQFVRLTFSFNMHAGLLY